MGHAASLSCVRVKHCASFKFRHSFPARLKFRHSFPASHYGPLLCERGTRFAWDDTSTKAARLYKALVCAPTDVVSGTAISNTLPTLTVKSVEAPFLQETRSICRICFQTAIIHRRLHVPSSNLRVSHCLVSCCFGRSMVMKYCPPAHCCISRSL